jgi:hypothetical protein
MKTIKSRIVAYTHTGGEFATSVRERSNPPAQMASAGAFRWSFCRFCGRQTEYAVAIEAVRVFKKIRSGLCKAVPLTATIRAEAQTLANALVEQFKGALEGCTGPFGPGKMLAAYCDIREMCGDFSVDAFRDQVERNALITIWAKNGNMAGAARLPGDQNGSQRPSKLYCDLHYPGRSDDARRAYQRDRKFVAEYEELICLIWEQYAGRIRQWHVDDHAFVRHAAYHHLRLMKSPTRALDDYVDPNPVATYPAKTTALPKKSIADYYEIARKAHYRLRSMAPTSPVFGELTQKSAFNQSEIARLLGVKRQAVSAALKRRARAVALEN